MLLEVVRQEVETCHGWIFCVSYGSPRLRSARHLPAIIATEALASRIKGTAVYGRRTMLAIANPSTAVEGKVSEDPDK